MVLSIDGTERIAGAGTLATVPAGVAHRFHNRSEGPARLVVVTTGGGHVAFLRGMAELAADGIPEPGAVQAHAAAHHVELLV